MQPCSGVLVFPTTTQPAARIRATSVQSASAGGSLRVYMAPLEVWNPAASTKSFTPMGTPASGPTSSPASRHSSRAAAWRRAPSASTATKAFSTGLRASMRFSACSVTAAAVSVRSLTMAAKASTVTVRKSGTSISRLS